MGARIHLFLGDEILQATDEARGDLSRSAFIRRALTTQLEVEARVRETMEKALMEAVK